MLPFQEPHTAKIPECFLPLLCLFSSVGSFLLGGNFLYQTCKQCFRCHRTQIDAIAQPNGDGLVFNFLITNGNHIRHFFQSCLPNLITNLFCTAVDLAAQTCCCQLLLNCIGKIQMPVCNRNNFYLFWCQASEAGAMAKLKPEFLKHKKHLDSILPDILRCPHVPGAEKARAVLFCAAPGLTYTLAHARGKLHGSKTD